MSPRTTTSWRLMSSPSQSPWPTHSSPSNGSSRMWITMTPRSRRCFITHTEYTQREGLSVGQSSSSVSERTVISVGEWTGRLVRPSGQELNVEHAQIRTLLDRQREQILAECQAEIWKHEFLANDDRRSIQKLSETIESQQEELHRAQAEELHRRDQQLLHEQSLKHNWDLREAHEKSLKEMKELKKFQSSTFDTFARRRLVEDQDTILELTGKIQELQNEINCMNDSRDFQDAESVRSGHSHVTSQPVSFPPHPIPEGMLSRSNLNTEPQRRAAKHFGHAWYIGKRFCKSSSVLFSTLSAGIESMEFRNIRTDTLINSGKEWETNTSSRSEMPVWTVSQKFSHLQWRRLFKDLWGRPTTTADFGSSFWQVPYTSHVCLLEDKIQDWGMYLFTISYGSYAMDQRSGDGWFSGFVF